ncbi:Cysteine-rich receptor-like protein kinase 26 [Linum perenne]
MNSLFLLLLLLLLPSCITAADCSIDAGNYTAGSTYRRNLNNLLASIAADNRTSSRFYNSSSGQAPDRVNVIGLCRGDVTLKDCRECMIKATSSILEECPNQKEAFSWYDNSCMIRFSNRSIFHTLETSPTTYFLTIANASGPIPFREAVETLFFKLRGIASSSRERFAMGEQRHDFRTIYGLLQCSHDLSSELCDECLSDVISQVWSCCEVKLGGGVINPSCYMRFEIYRFYKETESLEGTKKNTAGRIIAIVVPIAGASVLGFVFFLFCYRCKLNQRSNQNGMTADELSNNGSLQFDFDIIKAATNEFANENKLGEGGFGVVYKGTLQNGQDIAVKRLDKDSRQGDLEFKNEVKLVAKLQHRNLVRLLGFCLEGRERLLIYEFVPNASLDRFLFNQRTHLDWERRYKIIGGIARGLVYLHVDSRLRIIHRDLKVSNILLDADMRPKIADFGMARLFDIDETHDKTNRIVGTYGYMAPEYAYHGKFSVKTDVFSFGVTVLEIVSGQKINSFRHGTDMEDLLGYAWKNWKAGTYSNVIDPLLGNVSGTGIARCIHIGLLCVQENVNDRPTMTSVSLMLTSDSMSLQLPSKPAFFMHTTSTEEPYSNTASREGIGSSTSTETLPLSRNDVSITELYPR